MLRRASACYRLRLTRPRCQPFPHPQSLTNSRSSSTSFKDEPPPARPTSSSDPVPKEQKADKSTKIHSGRSPNGIRTRPRVLRPLLLPSTFSHAILPETPISDPQSSRRQEDMGEIDTSVAITLANLPPNTLKADIRPVFQQFGEIQRVIIGLGGTCADIIFTDEEDVKRTLHAYAEQPFFVQGREVIMYRKCATETNTKFGAVNDNQAKTSTAWQADPSRAMPDLSDGSGAIFVSQFPPGTTKDELCDAFSRFGRYERFAMRPRSRYAYFVYSSDDSVEQILRVHTRIPVTIRGESLRIERTVNRPYTLSHGSSDIALELGKSLDPAESEAILQELKQTVPRWRGTCEPSRVLWIGRLPSSLSHQALANFWSRLGCVVEVRPSTTGFAHIEFSSTEEALRAARHGAYHGFRYADRLLDVDFAPWRLHIGPSYRVVYISGWPASRTRPELLQWAYDIPYITGGAVLPPFRGEERTAPRGALLHFRSIDDARAGLQRLVDRSGPDGEALRVSLSCFPAVPLKLLWKWTYAEDEMRRRGEEVHFEREWDGLGFGTGAEERDGSAPDAKMSPVGTRGGRVRLRNRAGGAVGSGFADGEQDELRLGAHGDEALEAMQTAGEDAGRVDPDVRQSLA